jgi:ubiquinone/menaquinone biosynthesis C-methylase UbiE
VLETATHSGPSAPFDAIAPGYDADFALTRIGQILRRSVWSRLDPYLSAGMNVLDLGCGTGEDALWLAKKGCSVTAVDASQPMLIKTAEKLALAKLEDRLTTLRLDINDFSAGVPEVRGPFDVVLSNFGAMNCFGDLARLVAEIGRITKPGGVAALNVMSRFCAFEFLWHLRTLNPAAARRWAGSATGRIGDSNVPVRYWTVGQLRRALRPFYRVRSVHGVGVFLPPSYLFERIGGSQRRLDFLLRCEGLLSDTWPCSRWGDHTLVICSRVVHSSGKGES